MAGERLRVTGGKASGTEISFEDEFLIGRATTGEGRLGEDPELSRNHARIARRAGDQLTIEDLGSTNGTFVNGKRITDAQPLRPGDTVKLGTTTLQVLDETGAAPQATALGARASAAGPTHSGCGHPAARAPARRAPARRGSASSTWRPARPGASGTWRPARPGASGTRRCARTHAATATAATAPRGTIGRARGGLPKPLIAVLGLLLVGAVVGRSLAAHRRRDDESEEPAVLTSGQISTANNKTTVSINTKGPGFDSDGNEVVVSGGGTGVVVDAKRGFVLTNDHVVAGATSVKARLDNGEEVNARVRGQAPCEDLAVIELSPQPRGLKSATLGRSAGLKAGDKVTALGFPGAFEEDITERKLQSTEGTISSKPGPATLGGSLPNLPAVIQHQAPISPGNSGGPLFDDTGEVVGINTLAATSDSGAQNQNGAIAIDRAKSLLPGLENGEDSAYVGWSIQNIAELDNGLFVISVDSNSPADKGHMLFGDRIDKVDNTGVGGVPDVCDILGSKAAGDSVKVAGVELDGSPYTTTIKLR